MITEFMSYIYICSVFGISCKTFTRRAYFPGKSDIKIGLGSGML